MFTEPSGHTTKAKSSLPEGQRPYVDTYTPCQFRQAPEHPWIDALAPRRIEIPETCLYEHDDREITRISFEHDGHWVRVFPYYCVGLVIEVPIEMNLVVKKRRSLFTLTSREKTEA